MIYYVIKPVSEVTQAQLNASGARVKSNTRLTRLQDKCVLKFDASKAEFFMNEQWLTLEEARAALQSEEWNHEAAGLIEKTVNFLSDLASP